MSGSPSTSYAELLSAAPQIGYDCMGANKEFMKCKMKDQNPSTCLAQGEKVTACALKVLRKAQEQCADSFKAYHKCVHESQRRLEMCRDQQEAFERCYNSAK